MFVKRSAKAVTGIVRRFMDDFLALNWNDHTLAELGTVQKDRRSTSVTELDNE